LLAAFVVVADATGVVVRVYVVDVVAVIAGVVVDGDCGCVNVYVSAAFGDVGGGVVMFVVIDVVGCIVIVALICRRMSVVIAVVAVVVAIVGIVATVIAVVAVLRDVSCCCCCNWLCWGW